MGKTALAVMRLQPLHEGHRILIERMFGTCERVIIAVGSTQESGTDRNPYSYEARRAMILEHYGDRPDLSVIPLIDIGAQNRAEWITYLRRELDNAGLPEPTDYFSGSREDADWYIETGWRIHIVDRMSVGKGISATAIRQQLKDAVNKE